MLGVVENFFGRGLEELASGRIAVIDVAEEVGNELRQDNVDEFPQIDEIEIAEFPDNAFVVEKFTNAGAARFTATEKFAISESDGQIILLNP